MERREVTLTVSKAACLRCVKLGKTNPGVGGNRGMCPSCYRWGYRSVLEGRATWEELERAGMCRAAKMQKKLLSAIDREVVEAAYELVDDFDAGDDPRLATERLRSAVETHRRMRRETTRQAGQTTRQATSPDGQGLFGGDGAV